MSGKIRLLNYFKQNIGVIISRDKLSEVAAVFDWQRPIRSLRQEGWQIDALKEGYILHSPDKILTDKKRETITGKLRYQILQRDNSTCQRCGKTIVDGIKLEVDHKIPVEWGGDNSVNNLWILCNICNGGKKHFFADLSGEVMKRVLTEKSAKNRLKVFFELNPNVTISTQILGIISKSRDWTRTLRYLRKDFGLNINYIRANEQFPEGAYINTIK